MVDGWKSCIVSAKSFKIAIPGIWTLNEKICAMVCIDPENLMRFFTRNLIFYSCKIFFGEEIGRDIHENEKKVVKKESP
jgi:hypothetical protein